MHYNKGLPRFGVGAFVITVRFSSNKNHSTVWTRKLDSSGSPGFAYPPSPVFMSYLVGTCIFCHFDDHRAELPIFWNDSCAAICLGTIEPQNFAGISSVRLSWLAYNPHPFPMVVFRLRTCVLGYVDALGCFQTENPRRLYLRG
jgi:hypothetical protein